MTFKKTKAGGVKPVIVEQTHKSTITSGASHTFKVKATGTKLAYAWQVDTGLGWQWVKGADKALLKTKPKQMINMPESYRCVVSNKAGSILSALMTTVILVSKADIARAKEVKKLADTPIKTVRVIDKEKAKVRATNKAKAKVKAAKAAKALADSTKEAEAPPEGTGEGGNVSSTDTGDGE